MSIIALLVLLLVGSGYLLMETRITLAFLKQKSAKMHLWERLAYRVSTSTAELLLIVLIFPHAFQWVGELLSVTGASTLPKLSSGGLQLWPVIALAGVRVLIYRLLEQKYIRAGLALVVQIVALISYMAAVMYLLPPGETATNIAVLLALHFVGDFTFQADGVACDKGRDWRMNTSHALMYTGLFALSNEIGIINLPWEAIVFLLVTHLLIDPFKARWEVVKPIWVDQCFHILVLLLVAYTPPLAWAIGLILLLAAFIAAHSMYDQKTGDDTNGDQVIGISRFLIEVVRPTIGGQPHNISRLSVTAGEDDHSIRVNGRRLTAADKTAIINGNTEISLGTSGNNVHVKVEVVE